MKLKLLCLTAIVSGLAGCSSTKDHDIEPLMPDPVYQERCYSMDSVDREVAGRAYLAEGHQFYFQTDCSKYLALPGTVILIEPPVAEAFGTAKNANSGDKKLITADQGRASANQNMGGSQDSSKLLDKKEVKAEKEPTCYFDKMTAGRGDLPPCPFDEKTKQYIKD